MTALFQRGPAEEVPRFQLSLDRVTIDQRSIDSAVFCVQSFVRDPLFTQRDFFTDNGISMFLSAVNVAGSVCEDSVYDPWTVISPEGYAAVVADLKRAYDVVVVRRKEARDTSERWVVVASVASSAVGESSGPQGVRFQTLWKSVKWNNCPSLFLPYKCPVRVSLSKTLGMGNRRKVGRPPKLQSSVVLNSTMSR